jgi:plastocyanin
MRRPLSVVSALAAVIALGAIAGCGGSGASSKSASSNAAVTPVAPSPQNVALKIAGGKMAKALGYTTPDGKGHDTYIPSSFSVTAGGQVTVTVTNYDEGPHSFTSPALGLNVQIPGAKNADKKIPSVTTFTFTVKQAGKYRWYCAIPCDHKANLWAMTPGKDGPSQDGYMAGFVTAT